MFPDKAKLVHLLIFFWIILFLNAEVEGLKQERRNPGIQGLNPVGFSVFPRWKPRLETQVRQLSTQQGKKHGWIMAFMEWVPTPLF